MIEFEREWQGVSRPYLVNVTDIVSFEPAGDPGKTLLYVRGRGEVMALADYQRVKRLVSLVRNQMASLIDGDA